MDEYKTLILRANRNLGAILKEKKLITDEALDQSYQKLLVFIKGNELDKANLPKLLIDNGDLNENAFIKAANYPVISLKNFDLTPKLMSGISLTLCKTTWTIPFSYKESYLFLATCYNFSQPVIDYWEKNTEYPILWHITTPDEIEYGLQQISAFQAVLT